MSSWVFNAGAESWSTTQFSWDGTDGSPSAGCLTRSGSFTSAVTTITGLSIVVPGPAAGHLEFRFKTTGNSDASASISMVAKTLGGATLGTLTENAAFSPDFFSDVWITVSNELLSAGTVENITITASNASGFTKVSVDSIYVNESPPAAPTSQLRWLGMDSDQDSLYVTGIQNGTISFITYSLATNNPTGTSTFGTCDYAEPDTFTRGLWPVIKPGGFGVVYAYGRDATNRQVLYNDTNGTLGWVDVGAGTATWATSKFCVALAPWRFGPLDVIAVFADDDIYQTLTGTSTWAKLADAPQGPRTAARRITTAENLLIAGTAAGTLSMTPNLGASFGVAGGTAIAGTINHIELGWWDGNQ